MTESPEERPRRQRTAAERAKAAADRARQRRNKARDIGLRQDEKEPSPREIAKAAREAAAAAAGLATKKSARAGSSRLGKTKAGLSPLKSSAATKHGNDDEDEFMSDSTDDYDPNSASPSQHPRRRSTTGNSQLQAFKSSYQQKPTLEDLETAQWVERDGQRVPRLVTVQPLSSDLISQMNGIEAAHAFEKQGPGFFDELFETLKQNNTITWRRCMQTMARMLEQEEGRFAKLRETATELERRNYSYLVPEDMLDNDEDIEGLSDSGWETMSEHTENDENCQIDSQDRAGVQLEQVEAHDEIQAEVYEHDLSRSVTFEHNTSKSNCAAQVNSQGCHSVIPAEPLNQASVDLAVYSDTTCNSFMADLTVYAHAMQGRRPNSVQRELQVAEDMSESREYRFKKLANLEYNAKIAVHRARAEVPKPAGVRDYATLRAAFDHVAAEMNGPKSYWADSNQWFLATIDVLNADPQVARAIFQYNTHYFLEDMRLAMVKADEKRSLELLERRSEESYADLTGYGRAREFKDDFKWIERE